jgi:hypothetical protein
MERQLGELARAGGDVFYYLCAGCLLGSAGSTVTVAVSASTSATDGEQVGIFHSEYSIDGGKSWIPSFYEGESGARLSRKFSVTLGAQGGKTIIRIRVAFRGGAAGDVDLRGGAIQWGESWEKWQWPAAKYAIIYATKA